MISEAKNEIRTGKRTCSERKGKLVTRGKRKDCCEKSFEVSKTSMEQLVSNLSFAKELSLYHEPSNELGRSFQRVTFLLLG